MFHPELQRTARARHLSQTLVNCTAVTLHDTVRNMVNLNGGSLLTPTDTDRPGTHLYQLDMLGLTGHGDTLEQAVRNWIAVARRAAVPELDAPTKPELAEKVTHAQ